MDAEVEPLRARLLERKREVGALRSAMVEAERRTGAIPVGPPPEQAYGRAYKLALAVLVVVLVVWGLLVWSLVEAPSWAPLLVAVLAGGVLGFGVRAGLVAAEAGRGEGGRRCLASAFARARVPLSLRGGEGSRGGR